MSTSRVRFALSSFRSTVLFAALGACNVFDESLLEAEPPAETEPALAVSDALRCDAPSNESVNAYRKLDLSRYDNNLSALPSCLGELDAPGNDTFFAVDMSEGEKWHFHVQVTSATVDPVIYVLDSCSDSRSCRDTLWGINACVEGENEHFSFIPPSSGRYFVAIDSLVSGGEPIEVFAVRAECGNLVKEHSEFCDDGNDDPSDGCHLCRPMLFQDGAEAEPNDGPLDPNVISFPEGSGSIRLAGTLGSRCDYDFFQLEIPEDAHATIALSGVTDCSRVDLQLQRPHAANPFDVEGAPSDECPSLDTTALTAGTYLVRVASRREPGLPSSATDYVLNVTLEPL